MNLPFYEARYTQFEQQAQQLTKRYDRLAWWRLVFFIGGSAVWLVVLKSLGVLAVVAWTVVWLAAFVRFVRFHQDIAKQKYHAECMQAVNYLEMRLQKQEFSNLDGGKDFMDSAHPYSGDLDIFGESRSIFQWLNRTTTALGRQQLATYLTAEPQAYPEIMARQAALKELAPLIEERQTFQALGIGTPDAPQHLTQLLSWLKMEALRFPKYTNVLLYLAPIYTLLAIALGFLYSSGITFMMFLPIIYLYKRTADTVNMTHIQTAKAAAVLRHYGELLAFWEQQTFKSPKLQELQDKLRTQGSPASEEIKKLAYLVAQLDVRNNIFAIILNALMLWDFQWLFRLDQWRTRNAIAVPRWFAVLAEAEAINSLATLTFNQPEWCFPEVYILPEMAAQEIEQAPKGFDNTTIPVWQAGKQALYEAIELGHPLIATQKRVCNNFDVASKGQVKLLTGSNMGGKSTFLRTVALSQVFAGMGAPVCARRWRGARMSVYTSMRTQDALADETSSFYAELKRLKTIIDAVESRPDVFFVLDEILKGTNSRDQHTGAKALVLQLVAEKGTGIVATHDLEIGKLVETDAVNLENLCFEVQVSDNDELFFDYKLRRGVTQSFNATQLMRKMGIRV